MQSSISVVIPHYGDPAPTLAVIDQLSRQRHSGAIQVIVADDHSPVPFPDRNALTAGGPAFEVVRLPRNSGFGSAVNAGAGRAKNPMLMVLNSDVDLGETFVSDLMAHAEERRPAVLGPRVIEAGAPKVTAWHWPTVRGLVAEWLRPLARWHSTRRLQEFWGADLKADASAADTEVDWLVGVCLLMPTSAFREIGGFDERYFMNCEEVDLQRRLAARGVPSVFVPEVILRHEGGGSSDPERKAGWLVDSRFRYHEKWGGSARLLAGLMGATMVNTAWNLVRGAVARPTAPWATAREESARVMHGWRNRKVVAR